VGFRWRGAPFDTEIERLQEEHRVNSGGNMASRTELLRFLDSRVFKPILKARSDLHSETAKRIIKELRR
jgi:hypothetical protein